MTRLLASLMVLAALVACRSPDDLQNQINARVLVVQVEDDELVQLDIDDDEPREASATDGVVTFEMVLTLGAHAGQVTLLKAHGDRVEPDRCGPIAFTVDADGVAVAVVARDLPSCNSGGGGGSGGP
jgi:hypothetical protein